MEIIYYAEWEDQILRSDECKPKEESGDSDWIFDSEHKMFVRYWSYHDEIDGTQYERDFILGKPIINK